MSYTEIVLRMAYQFLELKKIESSLHNYVRFSNNQLLNLQIHLIVILVN